MGSNGHFCWSVEVSQTTQQINLGGGGHAHLIRMGSLFLIHDPFRICLLYLNIKKSHFSYWRKKKLYIRIPPFHIKTLFLNVICCQYTTYATTTTYITTTTTTTTVMTDIVKAHFISKST